MTHVIALECRGVPPEAYPEDIKRCRNCVNGTAGEFEVPTDWSVAFEKALQEVLENRSLVDLIDQMQDAVVIPTCPKGGERYLTSTVFTNS